MALQLETLLQGLTPHHRAALMWFHNHAGQDVKWPGKLDGVFLASKGKAIYKPKGWDHALSIRQNLGSRYSDREPAPREDGSWLYQYSPESEKNKGRGIFTNAALVVNQADRVPVGVLRQVSRKPKSLYRVHGLALVVGQTPEHFLLEGLATGGTVPQDLEWIEAEEKVDEQEPGEFDSTGGADERTRIMRSIAQRRGGKKFRLAVLEAYSGRCAVTGCQDQSVLEAAHILPYRGDKTNHIQNGLLLRADIHTLFDLGHIAVDSESFRVRVSPALHSTEYRNLDGQKLALPAAKSKRPSIKALGLHLSESTAKWPAR